MELRKVYIECEVWAESIHHQHYFSFQTHPRERLSPTWGKNYLDLEKNILAWLPKSHFQLVLEDVATNRQLIGSQVHVPQVCTNEVHLTKVAGDGSGRWTPSPKGLCFNVSFFIYWTSGNMVNVLQFCVSPLWWVRLRQQYLPWCISLLIFGRWICVDSRLYCLCGHHATSDDGRWEARLHATKFSSR